LLSDMTAAMFIQANCSGVWLGLIFMPVATLPTGSKLYLVFN
jgi:hypothetical protein